MVANRLMCSSLFKESRQFNIDSIHLIYHCLIGQQSAWKIWNVTLKHTLKSPPNNTDHHHGLHCYHPVPSVTYRIDRPPGISTTYHTLPRPLITTGLDVIERERARASESKREISVLNHSFIPLSLLRLVITSCLFLLLWIYVVGLTLSETICAWA